MKIYILSIKLALLIVLGKSLSLYVGQLWLTHFISSLKVTRKKEKVNYGVLFQL